MEGLKTTVKLTENMRFGGSSYFSLEVLVHDVVREDVDIIRRDGSLEHGFKVKRTDVMCANFFERVNPIEQTIEALEGLVEALKERQNG